MVVCLSGADNLVRVGAKVCAALRDIGGESDLELFPVIVREAFYRDAMHLANDVVTLTAHIEADSFAVTTMADKWYVVDRVRSPNID